MFARMADIYETDTRAAIKRFTVDLRTAGDSGDGHHGRLADSEHAAGDYQHQRRGDMIMQNDHERNGKRSQAGVTLIEMLVVVTIIALFAALVAPQHVQAGRQGAHHRGHAAQINNFMTALGTYKLDTGIFPTTEQGLQALRAKPENVDPVERSLPAAGHPQRSLGPRLPLQIPRRPRRRAGHRLPRRRRPARRRRIECRHRQLEKSVAAASR